MSHEPNNNNNEVSIIRPYKVLRSILHPSFPILYLPEYISRRRCESCGQQQQRSSSSDTHNDDQCSTNKGFGNNNDDDDDNMVSFHDKSGCLTTQIVHEYNTFLKLCCQKNEKKKEKNHNNKGKKHANKSNINSNPSKTSERMMNSKNKENPTNECRMKKQKKRRRIRNHEQSYSSLHHHHHRHYRHPPQVVSNNKQRQQRPRPKYYPSYKNPRSIEEDKNNNNEETVDNEIVQQFVRMIIIPLSSNLISKVRHHQHNDDEKNESRISNHDDTTSSSTHDESNNDDGDCNNKSRKRRKLNNHQNNITTTMTTMTTNKATTNISSSPSSSTTTTKIVNPYIITNNTKTNQSKGGTSTKNNNNESLISLVDGVISSLVHKRQRMKRICNKNVERKNVRRHQYKRRKYNNNNTATTTIPYYELCHGRNLLSDGYSIATSDTIPTYQSSTTSSTSSTSSSSLKRKYKVIGSCRNMPPGIQCNQLNSCASYCRNDPVMKYIHEIIGDDLTREMLLHCIILVPVIDDNRDDGCISCSGSNRNRHKMTSPSFSSSTATSSLLFESGNYFQITGPPLSSMTLAARPSPDEKNNHSNHHHHHDRDKSTTIQTQKNAAVSEFNPSKKSKKMKKCMQHDSTISSSSSSPPTNDTNDIIHSDWIIPRNTIFYSESFVKQVGLSPSHLFNQWKLMKMNMKKKKDDTDDDEDETLVIQLLDSIVKLHTDDSKIIMKKRRQRRRKKKKRWKRIRTKGLSMCREILERHCKCDYTRLLERHCPLPSIMNQRGRNNDNLELSQLVKEWSDSNQVISFLNAVLKRVFPISFWGSEYNFQKVLETMSTFVKLRRHEQFPMKIIVRGIRILDLEWLFNTIDEGEGERLTQRKKKTKTDHEAATRLLQNQMWWLYCKFIIPLLRNTFYITDTEFTGRQVKYYRKPVWTKLRRLAMDQLLEKQFMEISQDEAIQLYNNQQLGYGRLRLLPKESGIRPIEVLCRNEALNVTKGRKRKYGTVFKPKFCTNLILKQTLDVLTYEYQSDPSQYGVGLFGFNHTYEKLRQFVHEFQELSKQSDGKIPLYFASVDIRNCYDNINQDHMLGIVNEVLHHEKYCIQQSDVLKPHSKKGLIRKRNKNIGKPENIKKLLDSVESVTKDSSDVVVVDSSTCKTVTKDSLMKLIRNHLFNNVVISKQKHGAKYLLQKSGIPQGSVLSTTLCNFYYGDQSVEKSLLNGIIESDSTPSSHVHLVMRIVDDFLIITTSKSAIKRFLINMNKGNKNLGVSINDKKTRVSCEETSNKSIAPFYIKGLIPNSSIISQGERKFFKWCGLLLDIENCSVHLDYTRFMDNFASDSLTVDRVSNEGMHLMTRLQSFIRPRCQPIFYDTTMNSVLDVQTNFYEAIAFCAIKSIHYVDGMSGGFRQNPNFVFKCMVSSIHFSIKLIKKRLKKMNQRISREDKETTIFHYNDFLSLGSHSYQWILRNSRNKDANRLSHCFGSYRKSLKLQSISTSDFSKVTQIALNNLKTRAFQF